MVSLFPIATEKDFSLQIQFVSVISYLALFPFPSWNHTHIQESPFCQPMHLVSIDTNKVYLRVCLSPSGNVLCSLTPATATSPVCCLQHALLLFLQCLGSFSAHFVVCLLIFPKQGLCFSFFMFLDDFSGWKERNTSFIMLQSNKKSNARRICKKQFVICSYVKYTAYEYICIVCLSYCLYSESRVRIYSLSFINN